ncbi:hypothetical protein BJ742DRAFT_735281 [Cladochytrium replicatum]|nr:hypothetical protein BJ742DRAFT_735281 [Cladochytrium replicatum]
MVLLEFEVMGEYGNNDPVPDGKLGATSGRLGLREVGRHTQNKLASQPIAVRPALTAKGKGFLGSVKCSRDEGANNQSDDHLDNGAREGRPRKRLREKQQQQDAQQKEEQQKEEVPTPTSKKAETSKESSLVKNKDPQNDDSEYPVRYNSQWGCRSGQYVEAEELVDDRMNTSLLFQCFEPTKLPQELRAASMGIGVLYFFIAKLLGPTDSSGTGLARSAKAGFL